MRCDKCKWWDVLTAEQAAIIHLHYDKLGLCRLEPTSEVTCSDNRCRHFDSKEETRDLSRACQECSRWERFTKGNVHGETQGHCNLHEKRTGYDCTCPLFNEKKVRKDERYGSEQGNCGIDDKPTLYTHTCPLHEKKTAPVPTSSADPNWVANEIGELWKAIGKLAEKK